MSTIVELLVRRDAFLLGQILPHLDEIEYSLEAIVPLGETPIPFIRVYKGGTQTLIDSVTEHPAVNSMNLETASNGDEIYRLDWDYPNDEFLNAVHESGGHILSGDSYRGEWQFTLQFPDHESVTTFVETLQDADIDGQVMSTHNPWVVDQDHGSEVTEAQREALWLAYKNGYYDVPRVTSTMELAEALGISDQAVSERLRRGTARMIESAASTITSE